jgi:hypothetical protein
MLHQRATTPMQTVAAGVTTSPGMDGNSVSWSVTIEAGTATTGTLAVTVKGPGSDTAETAYDAAGNAIVYNFASSTVQTYPFTNKPIDMLILTPSGLDGTYKYSFSQW